MKDKNLFIYPNIEVLQLNLEDIITRSISTFGDPFEDDENVILWTEF